MRNNEERIAAVKRRAAQMKREQQQRQSILISSGAVAACLVLITFLSIRMPSVAEKVNSYTGLAQTASIFNSGASLGYWVIGTVAFVLGVSVTILCMKLRSLSRETDDD